VFLIQHFKSLFKKLTDAVCDGRVWTAQLRTLVLTISCRRERCGCRNISRSGDFSLVETKRKPKMKISAMVLAAALTATSSFALAQAGSGAGATVPAKDGVAVNSVGAVVGTTQEGREMVGPGHDASTQGANTAGSAEKKADDTSRGGTVKK
jgi:hypothetical protein